METQHKNHCTMNFMFWQTYDAVLYQIHRSTNRDIDKIPMLGHAEPVSFHLI